MKLTDFKDPFVHFAKAIYIPFAALKRIGIHFAPHFGYGIQDIFVNDTTQIPRRAHQVTFTEPPTELKIIVCRGEMLRVSEFVFIQVSPMD